MGKRKIYLLYYNFQSTSGNHAGMAYLARQLGQANENVRTIKHIQQEFKWGYYAARVYAVWLALKLVFKLRANDQVFFMEYLSGVWAYQDVVAAILRAAGKKNKCYALVHLAGDHLIELYQHKETVLNKLNLVDEVVVLGSSLAAFLRQLGYQKKVVTTYHYVDSTYYQPAPKIKTSQALQVIFMGNIKRDFTTLEQIINQSSADITFHLCIGKDTPAMSLTSASNVKLYGYLQEQEMLHLMQRCDVNLCVLQDTIGSNVITTAMATGLVNIISEVGSVHDYCNENNSIFCNNSADFINALQLLSANRQKLTMMQHAALQRAQELSLSNFIKEFNAIVA